MTLRKRHRKIWASLGIFATSLFLLVVALPLWLPWLLRPLAARSGASYAAYQREGYHRFVLQTLRYTNSSISFTADKVEAPVPTVWLWEVLVNRGTTAEPFLFASGWQLEIRSSQKDKSRPSQSTYTNVSSILRKLETFKKWVPVAVLSNGTIQVSQTVAHLPTLTWSHGLLTGDVDLPRLQHHASISADLHAKEPYRLVLHSASLHLDSDISIFTNAAGLVLQSTNSWWSNRLELQAQFARNGTLPETVSLNAPEFALPAESTHLRDYRQVNGSATAKWQSGRFEIELRAEALPLPSRTNVPPVDLNLQAHGDTNLAIISSALITSPGLRAELSRDLKVQFAPPYLPEPAFMKVTADLSRLGMLGLEGELNGVAQFAPSSGKYPTARFQLSGSQIGKPPKLKTRTLALEGFLNWPLLDLSNATATFDDGSSAVANGQVDLEKKSIGSARLDAHGPVANRWLPAGYSYENLSLTADFQGSLQSLTHAGSIQLTNVITSQLVAQQVRATWNGQQLSISNLQLELLSGPSSLVAQGSVELSPQSTNLVLKMVSFRTNAEPALELSHPFRISVTRNDSAKEWQISTTPLDFSGQIGELHAQAEINWPLSGMVRASGSTKPLSGLRILDKAGFRDFQIRQLNAVAEWTNGPASFKIEFSAGGTLAKTFPPLTNQGRSTNQFIVGPVSLELNLAGDQNGINISNLVLTAPTSVVATAQGILPATLNPSVKTNFLDLQAGKPLNFSLKTAPDTPLWQNLSEWFGIGLSQPGVDVNLAGTWEAPVGHVRAHAAKIEINRRGKKLPSLEQLKIELQLDRKEARLTTGQVLIQGQPLIITGAIPLGESFWSNFKAKGLPNLANATAHVRMEEADIAAAADLLPGYLSPEGRLSLDFSLLPGGKLDGELKIEKARTRPLATLGPIRDINVTLKVNDRIFELTSATANIGGSYVELRGELDLRGTNWLQEGVPPFILAVSGTNVPLSRQPESVIRSDLRLAIAKTNGAPPLITGTARLRDSFYLSDFTDLVPGKVAGPSRRPPYFSIDKPPLNQWRLAVDVVGDRFLRVRSTLFVGEASAHLRVEGTLQEPIALGYLKIDSGIVRFPFANLDVQQGFVTLTSEDPYRPQLSLNASSRQYGYDIRMQVTGFADSPVIQFSSNPPLPSEQILLMVTTGQLPKGGFELTPQQRAQTLAMFVGKDLLAKLGFGDSGEQRLTIHSGEEITESGRPTYSIEYKLAPRWSIVGEYDRFGDYNAGFKWNVYTR